MKPNHRKLLPKKISYLFLFLFVLDVFLVIVYYTYTTNWVATNSNCQSTYNTGLVFFHSLDEEEDTLTVGSILRLKTALDLHQEGKIQNFIVAGGNRKKEGYIEKRKPSGALVMAEWLMKNGVKSDKIIIDSCSYDTVSNIENALAFKKQNGLGNIVSISSPIHLFRIQYLLKKAGTSTGICSIPTKKVSNQEIYLDVHQEWLSFFLMNWFSKEDYLQFVRSLRKVAIFDCY